MKPAQRRHIAAYSHPCGEGHYIYRIETIGSNGASQMRGTAMVDFGRRNPKQMEQELLENLTKI